MLIVWLLLCLNSKIIYKYYNNNHMWKLAKWGTKIVGAMTSETVDFGGWMGGTCAEFLNTVGIKSWTKPMKILVIEKLTYAWYN